MTQPAHVKAFVAKFADAARQVEATYGLNPLTTLAQAATESGWEWWQGDGPTAKSRNNYFGYGGDANLKKYSSALESFLDYGKLLTSDSRYKSAVAAGYDIDKFMMAIGHSGYKEGTWAQRNQYALNMAWTAKNRIAPLYPYTLGQSNSSSDNTSSEDYTTTPVVITASAPVPTPVVLPAKKKFPVVPVAIGGALLVGTAIGLYYYNRKLRNRDGGFERSLGYVPPIQFPVWAKVTLALGVFTVGAAVVAYAAKKPKDTSLPPSAPVLLPNNNPNTTNSTIMGTFKGSEYINKLHPSIRQKAAELAQALKDAGIPIFINHDGHYRTFAEQDALYAKGRTVKPPYKTVTNAKGGYSNHNYGLAVDMVPVDGKWNAPDSVYKKMGKVAKSLGWEWGGDFKSLYDPCHFQIFFGYTVSQLRKKHQNGEVDSNGYVLLT